MKALDEQNVKGLVLDLRGNPGGLLKEGVSVAGHRLGRGSVFRIRVAHSRRENRISHPGSQYGENYPIVVIVNRYSACAAEIVAGALQDHDRAWILGDTTFGKGFVQTVYPLQRKYRSGPDHPAVLYAQRPFDSARLLQRFFFDYYYRKHGGTEDPLDVKQTDRGGPFTAAGELLPMKSSSPTSRSFELICA